MDERLKTLLLELVEIDSACQRHVGLITPSWGVCSKEQQDEWDRLHRARGDVLSKIRDYAHEFAKRVM